jgi:hypothetical protein
MIIYWKTLEKDGADVSTIPQYISSAYFGGVGRINSQNTYPSSPPYGSIVYRSDLKKVFLFKEDVGWDIL